MTQIDQLEAAIDLLGKTIAQAANVIGTDISSSNNQVADAIGNQTEVLDRIASALERIADKMEDD